MAKVTFQMTALHDVVKAGYVRYIGMGTCYAWQCSYSIHPLLYFISHSWIEKFIRWKVSSSSYAGIDKTNLWHGCRLRNNQQVDAVHLCTTSLQSHVSWRRTRIISNNEGMLLDLIRIITHKLPCQPFGVGSLAFSPLARGYLARPLTKEHPTYRAETDPFVFIFIYQCDIAR